MGSLLGVLRISFGTFILSLPNASVRCGLRFLLWHRLGMLRVR